VLRSATESASIPDIACQNTMHLLKRLPAGGGFKLKFFSNSLAPPYAILSHTWTEGEEVTYNELLAGTGAVKPGYAKIRFCGEQAAADGFEYFWVDTCCIDKSSSAELSEAINSMYSWYENATICYAYLSDVSHLGSNSSKDHAMVEFSKSKWFGRGWTLQELIAPSEVVFFSKEWSPIGTKSDLAEDLAKITGIDRRVLGGAHPSVSSIADRMSWASKRTTTREEDIAYSLIGIFDINMPLLYGEGKKAFIRLQEEIMKVSDDQSLFAWKSSDPISHAGLLAASPEYFDTSRSITSPGLLKGSESSSTTSRGICANFGLQINWGEDGTHFARLACHRKEDGYQYAIVLQHIQGDQYIRINTNHLEALGPKQQHDHIFHKAVYVRQNLFQPLQQSRFPNNANVHDNIEWFWIRGTKDLQFSEPNACPRWYQDIALFGLDISQIGRVLVTLREPEDQSMSLLFRIYDGKPFCMLEDSANLSSDMGPWEELGLGTYHERIVKDKPRSDGSDRSELWMTARVSQVKIRSHPCTVITLCSKTVPLEVVRQKSIAQALAQARAAWTPRGQFSFLKSKQ
jgi:hypothetical protein